MVCGIWYENGIHSVFTYILRVSHLGCLQGSASIPCHNKNNKNKNKNIKNNNKNNDIDINPSIENVEVLTQKKDISKRNIFDEDF